MGAQQTIDTTKLLNVVKEAILSSTKKKIAVSPVKLATIFHTDYKAIEQYLDQFVEQGHIFRLHDEGQYPKVLYCLPEHTGNKEGLQIK